MPRRFLFILGSHRSNGNTELLSGRPWPDAPCGASPSAGDLPWHAEPLVSTINNGAAFMKMNVGGVLRGNGTAPGDILKGTEALAHAKTFFAQDAPPASFPGGYTRPESDTESAA
ncbi:hypothetical protein H8R17_29545 [Streptomyces sp. TRM68367]|nr:hypothetical protein [Streptomyces sp. TRM68367]MBC9728789.1 hypothetical protein [Streptomyces sp. TRM68367]